MHAQFGDKHVAPESWNREYAWKPINNSELKADTLEINRLMGIQHASYICATAIPTNIQFSDFSLSEILPNKDKVYRYLLKCPNALGVMVMFNNFKLGLGAKLWLYNKQRSHFAGLYTEKDNYHSGQEFLTSHVLGDEVIVEYVEPAKFRTPNFIITKVYYYFRGLKASQANGFGTAGSCMVNAACPEGSSKSVARDAACRIRVTGPSFSGFCTGTLVNNTSEDKTPYILTANHCSAKSTLSDLVNWEFDFLYQSSTCANPANEPAATTYKGCTAPAYSGTDNGEFSSDFLLLKLNSNLSTSTYDFTFLGWNRSDSNFSNNYCFHHPKGDIKKISESNDWTTIGSFGGNVPNTHFTLQWSNTSSGHSVTDEGSSGSALVNSNNQLIGTLTGGAALCNNLNGLDFYGRLFMHWDKFGVASDRRLKPWLDPINSGTVSLKSVKLSGQPLGISNQENQMLSFSIVNSNLNLSWLDGGYEISILNIQGSRIASYYSTNKDYSINIQDFSRGLYILVLQSTSTTKTVKIQL